MAFVGSDALDQPAQQRLAVVVAGEEDEPGAVRAGRGQGEGHRSTQEAVGHLDQDAGAVTSVGVGAGGAAVFEVDEQREGVADDGGRAMALDVGDEADAAGIVLVGGAVEAPLRVGWGDRAGVGRDLATLVALVVLR